MEAENGLVAEEVLIDHPIISDGIYDLPDEDWTYDSNKDYGEDKLDPEEKII